MTERKGVTGQSGGWDRITPQQVSAQLLLLTQRPPRPLPPALLCHAGERPQVNLGFST